MIRKVIQIDREKCNGCGACAAACHEGAIGMVDGKAQLMRDDYCDGLGDCLPSCPTNAITFIEKETVAYDRAAVEKHMEETGRRPAAPQAAHPVFSGCPGSRSRSLVREPQAGTGAAGTQAGSAAGGDVPVQALQSQLQQWPVQIKLAPVSAPYFQHANLLVAADCTAYAFADFHRKFIRNHITLIGCPKLDEGDYADKLTEIIAQNDLKSITVVRMEVPCCGGIEHAVKTALQRSGKMIPWQVVVISTTGEILDD